MSLHVTHKVDLQCETLPTFGFRTEKRFLLSFVSHDHVGVQKPLSFVLVLADLTLELAKTWVFLAQMDAEVFLPSKFGKARSTREFVAGFVKFLGFGDIFSDSDTFLFRRGRRFVVRVGFDCTFGWLFSRGFISTNYNFLILTLTIRWTRRFVAKIVKINTFLTSSSAWEFIFKFWTTIL